MACHSYSLPPNTTRTSPPYSTFVHTLSSLSPSPPHTLPASPPFTHYPTPSSALTHSLLSPPHHTHSLPLSSPSLTHSILYLPPHPSPSHPSTAPLTVSTMTALSLHLSTTVVMVRQTTSRPRMTLRARRSFQSFQAWLGRREHRQHKLRQNSPNQHLQKTLTNEIDRCIVNQPLHNESNTLALTSILV